MENRHNPDPQDADTPTPQDLQISEFIDACKQQGRELDLRISEFIETNKNQFEALQTSIYEMKEESREGWKESRKTLEEFGDALTAHDKQCRLDNSTLQRQLSDLDARIKFVQWQAWAVIAPIYGTLIIFAVRALFA